MKDEFDQYSEDEEDYDMARLLALVIAVFIGSSLVIWGLERLI